MADRAGRPGRRALPAPPRRAHLALALLEQVIVRDRSPGTIAALLPVLRQIADAAQGSDDETPAGLLVARALENIDPDASARQLRGLLAAVCCSAATTCGIGDLGIPDQQLPAGRTAHRGAHAGRRDGGLHPPGRPRPLDPAAGRGESGSQILTEQGHADQVLAEVTRLRQQMAELPEKAISLKLVVPYNVRESILDTGRSPPAS